MENRLTVQSLEASLPHPPANEIASRLEKQLSASPYKIVVLDDDPTGVQTVHNVSVYTDWEPETIRAGFEEDAPMFFLLTNSRSFTAEQTEREHAAMARGIAAASRQTGKPFLVISRGDSTLRGHYPLETETLRRVLEEEGSPAIDGEVVIPFFPEGGRYTAGDVHYVADNAGILIPAGETEFAKDRTFGYHSSNLREWIEEKTAGSFKADTVVSITLDELRALDYDGIAAKLEGVSGFGKVIVNALCYDDVKVFVTALLMAMSKGRHFLFRSAAALTKVIGGVPDRPLLTREDLIEPDNCNGGLVIAGSHVKKTTDQLAKLGELPEVEMAEFNQHLVLDDAAFAAELDRVIALCERNIAAGKTTAVFTRRERLDLNTGNPEDELRIAVKISDALTSIVTRLTVRPSFLIAKGGITSSDVGTKGLGVKKARVMGQVRPGIPVWMTGPESKFPELPYVIFPGNVGTVDDLKTIVATLMRK